MDREEYCLEKLKDIDVFALQVKNGYSWFAEILNDDWFSQIKIGGAEVWLGYSDSYHCRFFPFRWLFEEEEWGFINTWFGKLVESTKKIQILRGKLDKIVDQNWMSALTAALEIKAYCTFVRNEMFLDIDPKVNPESKRKADALINIDDREIIVEITACTKSLVNPFSKAGALPVPKMIYQIISKIKEKAEKQLFDVQIPVILIIALPPRIGADHYSAKWAVDECLRNYPQISSVLISDSYLFKYGAWYYNSEARFPLTQEEKQYVSNLLILNRNVQQDSRSFGIFQE